MKPKHKLSFNQLSATEFEEFCYDLLEELGFTNLDWRKGTGKKSSPSDSGRDIVGHIQRLDVDMTNIQEKWFVDCKHHTTGIPARELQNLLAWAEAERPDVALFIVSNFLTNSAKDYLEAYKRNNRPAFKIRYWERPRLESITRGKRDFLQMFGLLKVHLRSEREITQAEKELWDRVWYYRHLVRIRNAKYAKDGNDEAVPAIAKMTRDIMKKKRKQYGRSIGRIMSDFDWGYMQGKFSAIRWTLGDEWDFLDT
jgi:Restriction endonuclease